MAAPRSAGSAGLAAVGADGAEDAWTGRVGKVYTRCADGWKLIMHTGVLVYR